MKHIFEYLFNKKSDLNKIGKLPLKQRIRLFNWKNIPKPTTLVSIKEDKDTNWHTGKKTDIVVMEFQCRSTELKNYIPTLDAHKLGQFLESTFIDICKKIGYPYAFKSAPEIHQLGIWLKDDPDLHKLGNGFSGFSKANVPMVSISNLKGIIKDEINTILDRANINIDQIKPESIGVDFRINFSENYNDGIMIEFAKIDITYDNL